MTDARAGRPGGDAEDTFARFARLRRRLHPPPNEIPGLLPIGQFLGRSDLVAAVLLDVHAYSVGLEFRLTYRGRGRRPDGRPPFVPTQPELAEHLGIPAATSPDVALSITGGAEAVSLERSAAYQRLEHLTDHFVLVEAAGGGGNDQLDATYWLTPHPRAGVTLRFSWPEQLLPPTSVPIDVHDLGSATSAAVVLWPWDPSEDVR